MVYSVENSLGVSKPMGSSHINSQLARFAASSISALDDLGRSYAMFSAIVPVNRTGSCGTSPMCARQEAGVKLRISSPSNMMLPSNGYNFI
jgi:hypothetical protein